MEKNDLDLMEDFKKRRINLAKKGLFYAWISAVTMVVFSLFNSGAQSLVLGKLGGNIWVQIAVALIVLGIAEFGAGIILIVYKVARGTPLGEYKALWHIKASRIALLSAFSAGPIATTCLMIGVTFCGVTYANSLLSLAPMVSAIIARIIFKERLKLRAYLGIAIAVAGIIVASYIPPEGVENFYLGILFSCFAPLGFAGEAVLSSHAMDITDPIEVCGLYRSVGGGILEIIIAVIICAMRGDVTLVTKIFGCVFSESTILIYIFIAMAFIAVEYGTIYIAYNYCGPTRGTAIVFSTPVWSIPVGFMLASIFPYNITPLGMIGAIVVVIGMVLIVLKPSELFSLREYN